MTQLQDARSDIVTDQMKRAAEAEPVDAEQLRQLVAEGRAVIPVNAGRDNVKPVAIGEGLTTKVNANIGTSPSVSDVEAEMCKLAAAEQAGADTVMDLSIGEEMDAVRRAVVEHTDLPLGTVPMYQAALEAGGPEALDLDAYLRTLQKHAEDGVDFVTVHAGIRRDAIPLVEKRLMGVVSRGGSFLVRWMREHGRESFLYEGFDEVLAIAEEYDLTMSLGDGLRPGCQDDATDDAQLHELNVLGELAERCREAGVQVMIEGPGHVPLNDIARNMELEKERCANAPFYVLGPLPTDSAPGYDHMVSAIGGALAAYKGADFLCYVTPKEHVGLPDADDVREGVVASRIAAHIGDLALGLESARARDTAMSKARAKRDWDGMMEHCLDPRKFRELISDEDLKDQCSMCDQYCAIKIFRGEEDDAEAD